MDRTVKVSTLQNEDNSSFKSARSDQQKESIWSICTDNSQLFTVSWAGEVYLSPFSIDFVWNLTWPNRSNDIAAVFFLIMAGGEVGH
jgi:hypothetical protein